MNLYISTILLTQWHKSPNAEATGSERRFIQDIVFYAPATEILLDRPLELPHFAGQVRSWDDF